jgi:hypothetical protein
VEVINTMAIYTKTLQFFPTDGPNFKGKPVNSDEINLIINEALEKIQKDGGKIVDVKITVSQMPVINSFVSIYLIIYDALHKVD